MAHLHRLENTACSPISRLWARCALTNIHIYVDVHPELTIGIYTSPPAACGVVIQAFPLNETGVGL